MALTISHPFDEAKNLKKIKKAKSYEHIGFSHFMWKFRILIVAFDRRDQAQLERTIKLCKLGNKCPLGLGRLTIIFCPRTGKKIFSEGFLTYSTLKFFFPAILIREEVVSKHVILCENKIAVIST